jgi:SAM-dependent methyltransferase
VATTEASIDDIRAFWDKQGREHGAALAATNPDTYAKQIEIAALTRALDPACDTLEAGCGNGYNLFALSGNLTGRLTGFDYAPALVEAAQAAAGERPDADRFRFESGNILEDLSRFGRFRQVFTDRCLINLPSLDMQLAALSNLAGIVEPGGRVVLVESTRQGQEAINALRGRIGLDPIPYHWHNNYLDIPAFLHRVPATLRHVRTEDFSSLYFVMSRVFNAALTPPGEAPDYMAKINRIAAELPSFGDNGPLKLFEFERVG